MDAWHDGAGSKEGTAAGRCARQVAVPCGKARKRRERGCAAGARRRGKAARGRDMADKFNVVRVRFHLRDERVLVIQGWKYGMGPQDRLVAALGGEELPMTEQMYDGMEVRQRYMIYDLGIEEEYFLYVTLPDAPEGKKEISLWVKGPDGEERVWHEAAAKVLKLRGQVDFFLEEVKLGKESCRVKGWAASVLPVELTVKGADGRAIPCEVSWHERRDVAQAYREAKSLPDAGFEARFPHKGLSRASLEIHSGRRASTAKVPIASTFLLENVLGSSYLGKGARFLQRHGFLEFCKRTAQVLTHRAAPQGDYERYRLAVMPSTEDLARQRQEKMEWCPLISIVVPLYRTPLRYLSQLIASVRDQTYTNWELCLSDGSGEDSTLEDFLRKLEKKDRRIKVVWNHKQLRISQNTNAALRAATGEYVAFADHDDMLTPDALYECVKALRESPGTELAYSDEDKVSMNGRRYFEPHFKPDYDPDLLRSMNYFCHLVVVKKTLLERVGPLDEAFDGAQDYDFVLRCVEHTDRIAHIPKVLYHWRAHGKSTAEDPESKRYAFEAGRRAVQAHYDRMGIPAKVSMGRYPGLYRTRYAWKEQPLVSILIPNKDHVQDLDKCIRSIEEQSSYRNYEYVILENNSELPETFEYYRNLEAENKKARVARWEGGFHFAAINNFGAGLAKGEYLLLLNNDTEMIGPDCIRELLGYCMREDVGVVGARLYYGDDTIQHAGVVLGFGGIAGHAFLGFGRGENGYFSRIICAQDYSAVTAACMMTKASVYRQVGGMTEDLAVAFNDIDYCMKVRKAGKLVVYNPYAELYHYESKSRGPEDSPQKQERYYREMEYFVKKWKAELDAGDPYYNPNLTLSKADFSLRQV